jgi:hypothetical protein
VNLSLRIISEWTNEPHVLDVTNAETCEFEGCVNPLYSRDHLCHPPPIRMRKRLMAASEGLGPSPTIQIPSASVIPPQSPTSVPDAAPAARRVESNMNLLAIVLPIVIVGVIIGLAVGYFIYVRHKRNQKEEELRQRGSRKIDDDASCTVTDETDDVKERLKANDQPVGGGPVPLSAQGVRPQTEGAAEDVNPETQVETKK